VWDKKVMEQLIMKMKMMKWREKVMIFWKLEFTLNTNFCNIWLIFQ